MARFIITGEYKDKATRAARKDLKGLTKDTEVFAKYAKKYYAIASAAAGYYAQKVLKESIKNALEDEKSQRVLALTLANVANATDAAVIATEQQISSMQAAYGVTDDLLRPALARLARSSGSASQAIYDLKLALDISAATGKSLEAVTGALGKALDGNYASLQRLGLGLDASILKSKDQNKIFGQLRTTFASFARNEAATTEGKFRRIAVAADEAKEIIGVALIDSINTLIKTQGGVDGLAKSFNELALAIGDTIRGFTVFAEKANSFSRFFGQDLVGLIPVLGGWLKGFQAVGKQQRINLALQKSITGQVISARNAEMMALKAKKESVNATFDGTKKTVDQLIAEEAARKAGFKITEDIDSIQTVAAANRLKQISEEKNLYIQSLAEKLAAAKTNADAEALIWEAASKSSRELLQSLWAKGFQVPLTYVGGTAVGGFNASVPSPISNFVPEQGIPSFAGGTAAAGGGSLALGGQTFNVTVNAGAIGSEEFLVGEIGNALTKYTRLGNTTAPAGFM